ncbi:MAG: Ig-like domain-containing protein, partial [Prevotellaceae bacterium]|nr:Ig-like domain-containing protein [Prevotellaceae bacterium]
KVYAGWKDFVNIIGIAVYTVSFDTQGGSAVSAQSAAADAITTAPAAPTRTGYTFGGWYKEPSCVNAWNFATEPVTDDITLYAKWTPTVSFIAVTGVSVSPKTLSLAFDATQVLTVKFTPTKPSNTTVTWSSSDITIATVDNKGKVTANSDSIAGKTTITVTTQDGNKTATCTVTVSETGATAVETRHAASLQIYPNPTTGLVYVDNPNGAEAAVYTLSGALVLRSKAAVIDLSRHVAGVYIIKVGNKVAKVVKE